MRTIPYRMLRDRPGEVRRLLAKEGELVLTSDNRPFAIMLAAGPDDVDELLRLIGRLRLQRSIAALRDEARRKGLDPIRFS